VLEGARTTFYREHADGTIKPMGKDAFFFDTAATTVPNQNGKGAIEASKLWWSDPRRRYYPGGFVLDPSNAQRADQYNLWKGFGVTPAPGEWGKIMVHICKGLCRRVFTRARKRRGRADYKKASASAGRRNDRRCSKGQRRRRVGRTRMLRVS
jgi:hypothetical protein